MMLRFLPFVLLAVFVGRRRTAMAEWRRKLRGNLHNNAFFL